MTFFALANGFSRENASLPEIWWFGMCCVAVLANVWCLRDALMVWWEHRDLNGEVTDSDRAIIRMVTFGSLRAEVVRLIVLLFFSMVAMLSLYYPPGRQPDPATMTERQMEVWFWLRCIWWGFQIGTGGLMLNSLFNVRERRKVQRHITRNKCSRPDPCRG